MLAIGQNVWALELITEAEAKLPAVESRQRGVTRGPQIKQELPGADGAGVKVPMHLKVSFKGRGGAKIDLDSIRISYLRVPEIDLLPRLKPALTAQGIDVSDVRVPVGEHQIRVRVSDLDGRESVAIVMLRALP